MNAPQPDQFFSGPQREVARAVAAGDPAAVAALAPRTDLDAPGAHDMTLLVLAMAWEREDPTPKRLEVITELVRAGATPGQVVPDLGSALDLALMADGPGPLRAMLDGGLSPDAMAAGGDTPALHRAANEDSVDQMRLLLDRGADVDARDALGTPAITDALRAMQLDQVDELLDRGADPRAVNRLGQSFPNVLEALMVRQPPGSPALQKMTAIRDRIVAQGVAWPPAPPEVERDRLRARGEEPIVPAGSTR
jgi:ankyrin repeat protein